MSTALLEIRSMTKKYGGFAALTEVNLQIAPGERLGIIGPNGSGKSTMMGCIAGALRPTTGQVLFRGVDISRLSAHERARTGIFRSWQIPQPFSSMSVVENLCVPLEYVVHRGQIHTNRVRDEAIGILEEFGLADKADASVGTLSQVELRKLELARAVAGNPTLLLSDEAMAGLSTSEVDQVLVLLMRLSERGITIIMIEHIMRAVMRFSQRIVCLDAGRLIADGSPDDVVNSPDVRAAYFGADA